MKLMNPLKNRRTGVHISIPIITVIIVVLGALLNPFQAEAKTNIRGEPYQFDTEDEFLIYAENDTGLPNATTRFGKQANWEMYENYDNIVFGEPSGRTKEITVEGKDMLYNPCGLPKGVIVYENKGYNKKNELVPNSCFPNDEYGGSHPTNWNWDTVSGAKDSWSSLTQAQEDHIVNSILYGNGSDDESPLYVTDISPTYKEFVRIDVPPTWKSSGSVYTENGGRYHASFTVKEMGGSSTIDGTITTDKDSYTISPGDPNVKANITVEATAKLEGHMKARNIKDLTATWTSLEVSPTGEKQSLTDETASTTGKATTIHETTKTFTRTEYPVGEYEITLNGEVSISSAYGDEETKQIQKIITLSVEGSSSKPIELEVVPKEITVRPSEKYQFRAYLVYEDGTKEEVTKHENTSWTLYDNTEDILTDDGLFIASDLNEKRRLEGEVDYPTEYKGELLVLESNLFAGTTTKALGKPEKGVISESSITLPNWDAEVMGRPYEIDLDISNIPYPKSQWKYIYIRIEKVMDGKENYVISDYNLYDEIGSKIGGTDLEITFGMPKVIKGEYKIVQYVK